MAILIKVSLITNGEEKPSSNLLMLMLSNKIYEKKTHNFIQ